MRSAGLILLIYLLISIFHGSRWALLQEEELPAVLHLQPQLTTIGVADSRGGYRLYQFHDGILLQDVIKLTEGVAAQDPLMEQLSGQPVFSGEMIKVTKNEGKSFCVEHSWLSAKHRILMQIPLHPDRMTREDWEALPGIGRKLALEIEGDRQKNGEFYEFSALDRVKGIGSKKLEGWKRYFFEKK